MHARAYTATDAAGVPDYGAAGWDELIREDVDEQQGDQVAEDGRLPIDGSHGWLRPTLTPRLTAEGRVVHAGRGIRFRIRFSSQRPMRAPRDSSAEPWCSSENRLCAVKPVSTDGLGFSWSRVRIPPPL